MKSKRKIRIFVTLILVFIMMLTGIVVYNNKDEMFASIYIITYPDRCVETFKNDVLVSEECTFGRVVLEKQQEKANQTFAPTIQWNLTNLT